MELAYVDTSCYVAIAFGEPAAPKLTERLADFDELISSNLLEAELRAVFSREMTPFDSRLLDGLGWVLPDRALGPEIASVLSAGYVRGADLWHLAVALYVAQAPARVWFVTLDDRQQQVAELLGFRTEHFGL
ncbi:PIN domain-containing protein [bacterium CPR1]|nr:PIN domain-containing protein [bacterium CPR1]